MIHIYNSYSFPIQLEIIDEIPIQFQVRNILFNVKIDSGKDKTIIYTLRPTKRGEYEFGSIHLYAITILGLISRRYRFSQDKMVPVYPSFIQMRKYSLLAISNRLVMNGIKKINKRFKAKQA